MRKIFAIALSVVCASAAYAVPTVDGSLTDSDYTAAIPGNNLADSGYGPWGIVSIRTFRDATDLYVGLSGRVEGNGNNFRLVVGKAGSTDGIPAGTALTSGNDGLSPFSGFNRPLAIASDLAIRFSGAGGGNSTNGFVSWVNYRTGITEVVGADTYIGNPTNGTPVTQATGTGTGISVAYQVGTWPAEGNAGVEFRIPLAALGATSATNLQAFALMGGGGGGNLSWSFIPGVSGYNTYDTANFNTLTPSQVISIPAGASVSDWSAM